MANSMIDLLRKAVASASASQASTSASTPVINTYFTSLSNTIPSTLQEAYGGAVKNLVSMLESLVKDPTQGKARSLVSYLTKLKSQMGASRFYGLISQLRAYLTGTPYLQLLEKALSGNTDEIYKYARAVHRAQVVRSLMKKTGLPKSLIVQLVDENGNISAERLMQLIVSKINALMGRGAHMTYQELAKLTGDIRVLLHLGVASLGRDKVSKMLSSMLRGRPKAEAIQLRKAIAYVEKGDVKALASLLKGTAIAGDAHGISQAFKNKAYQTGELPGKTAEENEDNSNNGELTEQQRFAMQMTNIMKTLGK